MKRLLYYLSKSSYFGFSIILVVFVISRLPFFIYDPIPYISDVDSISYFDIAYSFKIGVAPNFYSDLPGYPFFLYVSSLINNSLFFILFLQNIFSLFSICLLYNVLMKLVRNLTIPIAILLGSYLSSDMNIHFDTALLTDSLFTNTMIFFFSFLFIAFEKKKHIYFVVCSFLLFYAVMLRPAAVFLFVPYFISIVWMFFYGYKKQIISYVLPLVFFLLIIATYNLYSAQYHTFTFLPRGNPQEEATNRLVNKIKQTPVLEMNNLDVKTIIDKLPSRHIAYILQNSNNYDSINLSYLPFLRYGFKIVKRDNKYLFKTYGKDIDISVDSVVINKIFIKYKRFDTSTFVKICMPKSYNAKLLKSNISYFINCYHYTSYSPYENRMENTSFYTWPIEIRKIYIIEKRVFMDSNYYNCLDGIIQNPLKGGLLQYSFKEFYLKSDKQYDIATMQNSKITKLNQSFIHHILNNFFRTKLYMFISFLSFIVLLILFVKKSFKDDFLFWIFLMNLAYFSSLYLYAIKTGFVLPRYSFPTDIFVFLNPILLLTVVFRDDELKLKTIFSKFKMIL